MEILTIIGGLVVYCTIYYGLCECFCKIFDKLFFKKRKKGERKDVEKF